MPLLGRLCLPLSAIFFCFLYPFSLNRPEPPCGCLIITIEINLNDPTKRSPNLSQLANNKNINCPKHTLINYICREGE